MSDKHTPGPWFVDGTTVYAKSDDGYNRFWCNVDAAASCKMRDGEREADAHLIAAAPTLLVVCDEALAVIEQQIRRDHHGCRPIDCRAVAIRDQLRAALDAARGQERGR